MFFCLVGYLFIYIVFNLSMIFNNNLNNMNQLFYKINKTTGINYSYNQILCNAKID